MAIVKFVWNAKGSTILNINSDHNNIFVNINIRFRNSLLLYWTMWCQNFKHVLIDSSVFYSECVLCLLKRCYEHKV